MPKRKNNVPEMVRKTLNELVKDLACMDGAAAANLAAILHNKTAKTIHEELKDPSSDLYKAIPVTLLKDDPNGLQYLEILALVQPAINDIIKPPPAPLPEATIVTKETMVTVTPSPLQQVTPLTLNSPLAQLTPAVVEATMTNETTTTAMSPDNPLESLFNVTEDNKMLMDLAQEISGSINYEPNNGVPDMSDFMELMTRVSDGLQQKIESGDLDVNALEGQARNFLERIQGVPEVSEAMQNPELMESIMSMAGGLSGGLESAL